ncbi:hypothetical protein EV667_0235 [Ancylobacter aquaticus]|uniref:Uncharacterized protein n=1 Tax=Ancylobacter aquaticus TaxID=100 RepID=A0A4R1I5G1_ANCAQ|nr:hypothetical protein [Ancylobacter aquaticus]TCK30148.1 hypothetical protein EV667_0235 [Ancylobacter aquaticus]
MSFISHARSPGKEVQPTSGLPLFDWRPSRALYANPLHVIARRLAERCRVPFHVALAHAEQAGLGKEAC